MNDEVIIFAGLKVFVHVGDTLVEAGGEVVTLVGQALLPGGITFALTAQVGEGWEKGLELGPAGVKVYRGGRSLMGGQADGLELFGGGSSTRFTRGEDSFKGGSS